jgi:hypothetical protein
MTPFQFILSNTTHDSWKKVIFGFKFQIHKTHVLGILTTLVSKTEPMLKNFLGLKILGIVEI